jgi:hypothetical protein
VPAGGIGVIMAYNNAAYNDFGSNTLVHNFADGYGWFTFFSTSNGAMNNAAGTAGMLGASFT